MMSLRLSGGRLSLRKNTTIGFKGDTLFVNHGTGGNPQTGYEGPHRLVELSKSDVIEAKPIYNGHSDSR